MQARQITSDRKGKFRSLSRVSVNLQKMNTYTLSNRLFHIKSETNINQTPPFPKNLVHSQENPSQISENRCCFTGNKRVSFVYYLDLTPSLPTSVSKMVVFFKAKWVLSPSKVKASAASKFGDGVWFEGFGADHRIKACTISYDLTAAFLHSSCYSLNLINLSLSFKKQPKGEFLQRLFLC